MRTKGGRRSVNHIYPGTDRRFIEDLGLKQNDFTVLGVVQGPNYFAKVRALKRALEEAGEGILVHPFRGRVGVIPKDYTLVEDFTNVNVATFEMSFSAPTKNEFPTEKGLFNVTSFSFNLNLSIADFIDLSWLETFSDTLLAAENAMNEVYDSFDDMTRLIAGVVDNISSFKRIVSDAKDNVAAAIRSPTVLFDSMNDAFKSLNELSPSSKDTVNLISENIFGISVGNDTLEPTTEVRKTEISNNDTINQAMNSLALSYAYQNASLIDFVNDQELIQLVELLERQFLSISDGLDESIAEKLYELRNEFRDFADNRLVTIDKVITVNVKTMPLLTLGYMYYGSTDSQDKLINLNETLNPSAIEGEVKILTA